MALWNMLLEQLSQTPALAGLVLLISGMSFALIILWKDNRKKDGIIFDLQEKRVKDRDPFLELSRNHVEALNNNTEAIHDVSRTMEALKTIVVVSLDNKRR